MNYSVLSKPLRLLGGLFLAMVPMLVFGDDVVAPVVAAAAVPAAAPVLNSGDTAWMLTSTA